MRVRFPERAKKPGVYYALTNDGLELPVIDVAHPAFAVNPDVQELAALTEKALRSARHWKRMPAIPKWLIEHLVLGRGRLTRAIAAARHQGYLAGIPTYLMKLGPENFGAAWAKPIDRAVAASLPALATRVRLRDTARLLADGLARALERDPSRALVFVNIAGGPSADSLNALLMLRREHPDWLAGRSVEIKVLDLDGAGPDFGRRALAALRGAGAPLEGVDARFEHAPYDWSDAGALPQRLEPGSRGALVAASSEGGLFEYGSDEEIVANLEALSEATAADAIVVGSVTRVDGPAGELNRANLRTLKLRGLAAFEALAARGGWRTDAVVDGPLSHCVHLVKAG